MKTLSRSQLFRTAAVLTLLLEVVSVVALAPSTSATAQTGGPFNLAVNCNDLAYPDVTCEAAITDDRFGVTKPYIASQLQFQVVDVDANKSIETRLVTPTQAISVSLLLVMDSRAILTSRTPNTLLQTAKSVGDFLNLSQLTPGDQLAVLVPTTTMSALPDFDERVDSIFVAAPNTTVEQCPTYVQICNPLVQRARPGPVMPIYRALDRAITRVKGQPGRRAVVLISDGNKVNPQDLSQDIVIARANEAKVPIFIIQFGARPNEALLRPLVDLTGGEMSSAASVDELDERMAEIHKRLKTQLGLAFTAATPNDNQKHRFNISVNVANVGRAEVSQEIVAYYPVKPAIVQTLILNANTPQLSQPSQPSQPAQLSSLEAMLADGHKLKRQLDISPVVQLRGQIAKIEYRLDDRPVGDSIGPLQLSAKELNLADDVTHTLRIRVADAQGNQSDEKRYDFDIEPCTGLCWVQENTATAAAYAAVGMAALAVASLIGFALARFAQARRHAPAVRRGRDALTSRDVATKPEPKTSTAVASAPNMNGVSVNNTNGAGGRITTISAAAAGATAIPSRSRVTKILDEQPMAFLEFASDNVSHKRVGVGGHDGKSILFGWDMREDDPDNQVRIRSDYVSRTHAEIRQQGEGLYLTDLSSKSGTWLDGERIPANRPVLIKPGSKIKFADVTAVVKEA